MRDEILIFFLASAFRPALGIILNESDSKTRENFTHSPWRCLERARYERESLPEIGETVFECAKNNLYLGLMENADSEFVDVGDGVTFHRHAGTDLPSTRQIFPSGEPATFRRLIDAYSNFLSQRSVRWDMGFIYPGLVMRIGPTMTESGTIGFDLEKRHDDYYDRARLSPSHMLVRRTILPHLLGFRMSLGSLLPIVFGILLIVTKNAFVFTKVTLVMSILLTLKSLFLLQVFRYPNNSDDSVHHHFHRPSVLQDSVDFDDGFAHTSINRPRPRPHGYSITESLSDSLLSHIVRKLPSQIGDAFDDPTQKKAKSGKRNFSWEK